MLPVNELTQRKKIFGGLLGLATLATVLLAGSLASVEFLPGEPLPLAAMIESLQRGQLSLSGISLPGGVFYLLAAGLWGLLLISIIAFIVSPEIRRETIKRVIRYTIIILLLHGVIRLIPPFVPPGELPETSQSTELLGETPQEPLPSPPEFVVDPPEWLVGGVTLALFVVLLGVLWLFWRRFFKPKPPTSLELLTHEVKQTLVNIQAGADLKDTIMRCYLQMSQIISQEQGFDRRQAMTPREFEQFLAESGLANEHIHRLTRLFENVRYSAQAPSQAEEDEASACLTAIVQAYGQSS